jgi:hypothetical protein
VRSTAVDLWHGDGQGRQDGHHVDVSTDRWDGHWPRAPAVCTSRQASPRGEGDRQLAIVAPHRRHSSATGGAPRRSSLDPREPIVVPCPPYNSQRRASSSEASGGGDEHRATRQGAVTR